MDVYYIGGGQAVPVGSEYLGCKKDGRRSDRRSRGRSRGHSGRRGSRRDVVGSLACPGKMTVQVICPTAGSSPDVTRSNHASILREVTRSLHETCAAETPWGLINESHGLQP